ncbi:type II toxin-antitoxin system VapC family toxin [Pseudoduganella sp.]|uniref:type II toxin-antitoxin system VapC family toxin n=1 Tax=Pseudoduganella sp. TaxID=1880898 RepID=UPI0035B3ADCE
MKLVLDASMVLAWQFARQDAIEQACAARLRDHLADFELLAPAFLHLELANGLLVGERRGMLTVAQAEAFLQLVDALPLVMEAISPVVQRRQVLHRARLCGLTVYGASYLDLALRTGAILATFDRQLAAAMRAVGGKVYE